MTTIIKLSYQSRSTAERLRPQRAVQPPLEPQNPSPTPLNQVDRAASPSNAGRGGLALTFGKLFFLVSGLVQQIVLKAILGLSGYGALSTTLSIASIAYNPMVQAGIQGMSRETAALDQEQQPGLVRRLLRIHAVVALLLASAFFFFAPMLARALGAPHIAPGVRALSGVLLVYGLYAPLVGVLNGQKRFVGQAGLDAFAAALRTVGLLGGAYLGVRLDPTGSSSVLWTCLGFVAAAILVLAVAARITGTGRAEPKAPEVSGGYVHVLRRIWAGQILLNVLFQADALLLRRFAASAASLADLPEASADPYVGAYRATQLFCFLPFQLLTSVTFVLFPLLAQAKSRGETGEVARLINHGLRLSVILTGLLVSVLIARPEGLLTLVFGAETAALGAPSMRILALGMGAFAVLGVLTSALNSLGYERLSLWLFACATVLVGALCFAFVHDATLNPEMLSLTAGATTVAMLVTTIVASVFARRTVGGGVAMLSVLRTTLSLAIAAFVGARVFPAGVLWTVVAAPMTCMTYLAVQIITREITRRDWNSVASLVRR